VNDNVIELGYRRLVAQRLSFSMAAGPDFAEIHDPVTGDYQHISYADRRLAGIRAEACQLGRAYDHYLTSGSGILTGSYTDQFSASLNLQLSRLWNLGIDGAVRAKLRIPGTSSGRR
jgi:hypothetical protein